MHCAQIAYNASKAAVVKITQTLGCEWADRGVTVNCMSPGIVNTALIQARRPPQAPRRAQYPVLKGVCSAPVAGHAYAQSSMIGPACIMSDRINTASACVLLSVLSMPRLQAPGSELLSVGRLSSCWCV